MGRLLGVLALVALALIAPTTAVMAAHTAQDTQAAQDTLTAQDRAPPLPPLVQLTADLAAIAARIDEVERNLAAAPPESQAVNSSALHGARPRTIGVSTGT